MSQSGSFNNGVFPPGTVIQTLTGNTGGAIGPDGAQNINILGAHGINTSGAVNTITVAIDNTIILGDLSPVAAGSDALTLTTGDLSIVSGNLNLPLTADADNGVIEVNGNRFIHSFGATNTFVGVDSGNFTLTSFSTTGIGANALDALTSGAFNTAGGFGAQSAVTNGSNNASWGSGSLISLTTSNENSAFGNSTLNALLTGANNTALGYNSGSAYTTNESNNIVIGNVGVIADSATIRIGTTGTHTGTYLAGIDGVNVASTAEVVTMGNGATADKLGTAVITAGTGIMVTPGVNTITISGNGTLTLTVTPVNTSPYVVLSTDQYLSVDSSGGAIQINLPNAPSTGRMYTIKDRSGTADTNNITVTTVGGAVTIDGSTSYVMNTEYAAINVIFNGSSYEIF